MGCKYIENPSWAEKKHSLSVAKRHSDFLAKLQKKLKDLGAIDAEQAE